MTASLSMPTKMRPAPAAAPVPAHPADALVAGRIRERRQELAEHNPAAIEVAGAALRAAADAAYGRVPQLRADRQVRYREMQLHGEKALPIEDLAAIGLEGAEGERVLLAALRVLAARALSTPHLIVPAPAGTKTVIEAGPGLVTRRQMLTRLGKSQSWVERCYADGFPRGRRIGRGRSLWWSWPEIEAWMLAHSRPGRGIPDIHERASA